MGDYIEDSNFVCDVFTPTSKLLNQQELDPGGELQTQPDDPRIADGEISPEFE